MRQSRHHGIYAGNDTTRVTLHGALNETFFIYRDGQQIMAVPAVSGTGDAVAYLPRGEIEVTGSISSPFAGNHFPKTITANTRDVWVAPDGIPLWWFGRAGDCLIRVSPNVETWSYGERDLNFSPPLNTVGSVLFSNHDGGPLALPAGTLKAVAWSSSGLSSYYRFGLQQDGAFHYNIDEALSVYTFLDGSAQDGPPYGPTQLEIPGGSTWPVVRAEYIAGSPAAHLTALWLAT